MVEHRVCNARVTGSSPITSTSTQAETYVSAFFVKISGFETVPPPPPLLKNFLTIILKKVSVPSIFYNILCSSQPFFPFAACSRSVWNLRVSGHELRGKFSLNFASSAQLWLQWWFFSPIGFLSRHRVPFPHRRTRFSCSLPC